jgi:subtilisin family serine protease
MSMSHFSRNRFRISLTTALIICLGLIIASLLTFPSHSGAKVVPVQETKTAKKPRRQQFVPGEVLVRFRSESMAAHRTGSQRITAKDGRLLSMKVDNFDGSELVPGLRLARLSEGETLAAVAALREQPDVLYAEPNYILKADVTPNDTHFVANRQASMNTIGAPTAWNTKTGSSSIVVGVIDQGIDFNHNDLHANRWINPLSGAVGGGITGDVNGYNFVNNNGTVFSGADAETHASHVAGIIGAVGNNGLGVAGVNWSVGLMSLKFLDQDGFGDTADAIRALNYAKQMKNLWDTEGPIKGANIKVLNASFGGASFSQSFLDSLNQLNSAGILFVAAAGNTPDDGTREPNNDLVPHYPSNFNAPNVIAVAATDQADALATTFSHFGATTVDLAAPGDTILSTTPHCANPGTGPTHDCLPSFSDPNGDTYTFFTGTSMSTPHVSGAAALLWAQNPNLTVAQVKNLLLLGGDVRPTLIDKTLTGRRLNIGNSFQSLAENDVTAPGAVTNFHINSQNGRTINLGWTASGDDGAAGQASLYQLNFTDGGSGAVIPLKGVIPMNSGLGQIATVTIPYRHTAGTLSLQEFDNVGNAGTPVNIAIAIPQLAGDPYTTATGSAAGLSTGGINLNPNADDQYLEILLPSGFTVPFFGTTFDSITLSTNGALYFGDPPPSRDNGDADDVPSSPGKLGGYRMVAGLWDDLDLRTSSRADAGIFEIINPKQVIFRWQGVPCNFDGNVCTGGANVNFEIELNSNGVIKTRYGTGNTNLFPTVGIGGGGQDAYFIPSHTSEETPISLNNAAEVTFTPRAAIQLTQSSFNVNENAGSIKVDVSRIGDTSGVWSVDYATSDTAGNNPCSTNTGAASSRCDYLRTLGTVTFAAGETIKSILIPIVNDSFLEGSETFTITLSNPIGATLGTTASATLTINDDGVETSGNPIDNANFFVRQHYIDFLNREPDTDGLNFWIGQINSCGVDPQCIELKRINVSGAFFLSIEFQETGYLVYRVYKVAFGNLTTPPGAPVPIVLSDFLRDTQKIGQGVVVNAPGFEALLEANKVAYMLAFVQRPDFVSAYPNGMSPTDFVTQLSNRAGGPGVISPAEQANLINMFGGSTADVNKRAQVLRLVAEDQTLRDVEFNKAFVLMQYFGYLRRNPNEFPDTNFDGYNFWLNKLNQFNGNFINAEMVKSFLVAGEYRGRFGP